MVKRSHLNQVVRTKGGKRLALKISITNNVPKKGEGKSGGKNGFFGGGNLTRGKRAMYLLRQTSS